MINSNQRQSYDDIISLPHHVSDCHPQMPLEDRAAQFSPFAALTGHDAAVRETARLTEQRVELDENSKAVIDERLQFLLAQGKERQEVSITYFKPDERKSGGTYVTAAGKVKKIDTLQRCLFLEDGSVIRMDEMIAVEGNMFSDMENLDV